MNLCLVSYTVQAYKDVIVGFFFKRFLFSKKYDFYKVGPITLIIDMRIESDV